MNDQHMFVDFLKSDIQIETARAFKLRALRQLCRSEQEERFITEKCIREILKETDEDQIYNNILSNLEPDTKWTAEHTEIYLDHVLNDWEETCDLYKEDIKMFRKDLKLELDESNNKH